MIANVQEKIKRNYNYVSDPRKSPRHNAYLRLAQMKAWKYFHRPCNKAFHDLTMNGNARNNMRHLLGMGLKFIPTPFFTNSSLHDSKRQLLRDMKLHAYYKGAGTIEPRLRKDIKIYVRSTWTPCEWMLPGETIYRGHRYLKI